MKGALRYHEMSQQHRPTDDVALATEVRRLSTTGLTAQDIAVALRLSLPVVREMVAAPSDEAAAIHRKAWAR